MIRRRLFAYAMMMTAGVTSGYFIVQKAEILSGSLFMVTCGIGVCIVIRHEGAVARKTEPRKGIREIIAAAFCLLAGFLVFTSSYISYEHDLTAASSCQIPSGDPAVVTLRGTISSVRIKNETFRVEVSDAVLYWTGDESGDSIRLHHKVLASYRGDSLPYDDLFELYGADIVLRGSVSAPPQADNPGCFDYRTYLRSVDTGLLMKAYSIEYDIADGAGILTLSKRNLLKCREQFLQRFEDAEIREFIRGAVFGDKSGIEESIREDFNINGTGHILAVSGLHIGFLYSLLRLTAGKKKSLPLTLLIIGAVFIYGEMTLWSASTIRAVLVLGLRLMAMYVRKPFDLLSAVSAAAFMILLCEPYQLFGTGFQMSFLALLGIAFLSGPVSAFTGQYMGVMIAVQTGIMPITVYTFHRFNPLSILINIPVIAAASILVPVCIISFYISAAAGAYGFLPAQAALTDLSVKVSDALAFFTVRINSALAGNGGFSVRPVALPAGIVLMIYLFIFTGASEWLRVKILRKEYNNIFIVSICIVLVSSAACFACYNDFADDEVVFVSVGQGDCTHIRAGDKNILIDGGGSTDYNTGEKILMPYLLANGADRVELAMVTHLHTDHYKGIFELSSVYPIGRVGIPSDYSKALEERYMEKRYTESYMTSEDKSGNGEVMLPDDDRIMYLQEGSRINIADDVFVEPIWPLLGTKELSVDDPNENNMVYMIHYNGIRIMVTGDLLESDELEMIRYYQGTDTLRCDVLQVAHHGSKSSSSEAFLDAASPGIAVIQVGLNNWYGHPHQQTLDRLEERGIEVYRTDLNGAIGIDIRGEHLTIDQYK